MSVRRSAAVPRHWIGRSIFGQRCQREKARERERERSTAAGLGRCPVGSDLDSEFKVESRKNVQL